MATLLDTRYTYWRLTSSNTPDGNYTDSRFIFKMYLDYQETSNNRSRIYIKKYVQVTQGQYWDVDINGGYYGGSTVNGSSYAGNTISKANDDYGTFVIGTDYYWVNHNADGTGSFYYRGRGSDLYYSSYEYIAQRTLNLPTIPRYATITGFTATVQNPKEIYVTWSANATCDLIEYSTNSGSSYTTASGQSGTSGSFTISGLTVGTTYGVRLRVRRTDSQLKTESSTLSKTTQALNYISTSANFNIGTNIPITIVKADTGYTSTIALYYSTNGTDYTELRSATANGDTTAITLSTAEKNTLYGAIPNANTIYVKFRTETFEGATSYGYVDKVGTATVVNSNPVFTTFTYEDTNADTLALTSDDQSIIKGYSNLKATVSTANKAVAQNGATMSSYQLVIGSKQTTESYSAVADVELDISDINNDEFVVYAIDSRGNSTSVQISPTTYFEYTDITLGSANGERTSSTSDETTLTGEGTFFADDFGDVENSVSAVYYYKLTTEPTTWTEGLTTLVPVEDGSTYELDQAIRGDMATENLGFNPIYSYNIKVVASDELSSSEYIFTLGTGTPQISLHQDGVAINQPYDDTIDASLQVAGNVDIKGDITIASGGKVGDADTDDLTKLSELTASSTELNYVDGVTSAIQTQLDNIKDDINDSSWKAASLNTGWSSQYSTAPARYRKIGNVVYVEAFVDGTSAAGETIFTLPTGYRPTSQYKRFPVYESGSLKYCDILNSGAVKYLGKGSSSATWFCINTCFVV